MKFLPHAREELILYIKVKVIIMNFIIEKTQIIGKAFINFFIEFGKILDFIFSVLLNLFKKPFYLKEFFRSIVEIGYFSLPVVALTTLFAGMVLALQTYSGTSPAIAEVTIPNIIVLSITSELSPVLVGLMVAGRIGASYSAELATMSVTEQIDALHTLSTNPVKYLITPRVYAGIIILPFLIVVGDTLGILGGYIVSVLKIGFNEGNYIARTIEAFTYKHTISGLIKGSVFGLIITITGCYQGYKTKGGAQGVGNATTNSVVISSILILVFNYIITEIFVGV